jgi:hypothetical protein
MVETKRLVAVTAAFLGAGTSVVALPQPASAHPTSISFRGSTAEVGTNHVGLRVCNRTRGFSAAGQWVRGDGDLGSTSVVNYGTCESELSTGGIARYRLCVWNATTPSVCSGWKRT